MIHCVIILLETLRCMWNWRAVGSVQRTSLAKLQLAVWYVLQRTSLAKLQLAVWPVLQRTTLAKLQLAVGSVLQRTTLAKLQPHNWCQNIAILVPDGCDWLSCHSFVCE